VKGVGIQQKLGKQQSFTLRQSRALADYEHQPAVDIAHFKEESSVTGLH